MALDLCRYCKSQPVSADKSLYPFCSERCKQIDLGRWAKGDYAIPGAAAPLANEELDDLLNSLDPSQAAELLKRRN